MSSSRFGRFLALSLVAAVVPACGKTKVKDPPVLTRATPSFTAVGVAHWPLILLEFDQDMDASTINNLNIQIYVDNFPLAASPWGPNCSVTYLPVTRQVIITPGAAMTASVVYDIIVFPEVLAANGKPINAPASGGLANQFTIGTAANVFKPAFASAPTAVTGAGASGTIDFAWPQPTENAVAILPTYDIFMSTSAGSEDLFGAPFLTRTDATGFTMGGGGANGTLVAGVTYYFYMVVRDTDGNVTIIGELSAQAKP